MRSFIAALALVALAACGQPQAEAPAAAVDAGPGSAPDWANANYRAEGVITDENGVTTPIVMIRSGARMRMEFVSEQGPQVIITNPEAQEAIIITSAMGQSMAMRMSAGTLPDAAKDWREELGADATRTGSCSVAGESGEEWTQNTAEAGQTADSACVTSDGVILRGTSNGRVVWETTSVQRGAQDASLFQVPAGVQVMDLNQMMGPGAQDALEKMRQQMER